MVDPEELIDDKNNMETEEDTFANKGPDIKAEMIEGGTQRNDIIIISKYQNVKVSYVYSYSRQAVHTL